jgi:YVTN family beta-propeller protein
MHNSSYESYCSFQLAAMESWQCLPAIKQKIIIKQHQRRRDDHEFKKTAAIVWILLFAMIILAAMHPMTTQAEPFAYITNSGDNTVSVIDTATNAVTATIAVGGYPFGVAVHPDGATIYVTNTEDATVSVIDAATNKVTATIPVGGGPVYGVAVTPNGSNLYVAIGYGGVAVIDTNTNSIIHNITGLALTVGIAVHPDGSTAYVSSAEMGLYIIDTTTNTVVKNITEGWCSHLAAHPDGSTVYVSCEMESEVYMLDTSTNAVTNRIEGVGGGVAVHPDGSKVYVFGSDSGQNTVTVIDVATNTATDTIPIGNGGYGIATHPDGSKIYVVNEHNDTVSVIDASTHAVLKEIPVGDQPQGFGLFIGPLASNPISVTINDVIKFFDQSVATGSLIGIGNRPLLRAMRLRTMKSHLLNTEKWITQKKFNLACNSLNSAHFACDSNPDPMDLVTGASAPELNEMISELKLKLKCD